MRGYITPIKPKIELCYPSYELSMMKFNCKAVFYSLLEYIITTPSGNLLLDLILLESYSDFRASTFKPIAYPIFPNDLKKTHMNKGHHKTTIPLNSKKNHIILEICYE